MQRLLAGAGPGSEGAMKNLLLIIIGFFQPSAPGRTAEKYAATVLAGLKVATDGYEAQGKRKKKLPSVVHQELRFKFTSCIEVGGEGSSIVLQANPRLKAGYALARRVKQVLIREVADKGVKVSLVSCHK